MASQLSKKAALPSAKILATCRNNVSNTGPWLFVILYFPWYHVDIMPWKHFPHCWIFVGEYSGHVQISLAKGKNDMKLWCFHWCSPEQAIEYKTLSLIGWAHTQTDSHMCLWILLISLVSLVFYQVFMHATKKIHSFTSHHMDTVQWSSQTVVPLFFVKNIY